MRRIIMDLKVHRTMLFLGMRRAEGRLKQLLFKHFKYIWIGNWLTDMNQASAFFAFFDKNYDHYKSYGLGGYKFPSFINENKDAWVRLFNGIWHHEWTELRKLDHFRGIPDPQLEIEHIDQIGCYYPYDHFDVVDPLNANGNPTSREAEEFSNNLYPKPPDDDHFHPGYPLMTTTAYYGVFKYCFEDLLFQAYDQRRPGEEERMRISLHFLGRALHTLQDFFAHSNYIELLLTYAINHLDIDDDLKTVMRAERVGNFAAYCNHELPERTPVMTSRFDTEDTLVSILKIYCDSLVPEWQDLAAGGYQHTEPVDAQTRIFNILFGSFSDNPFITSGIKVAKTVTAVSDFFDEVGEKIETGLLDFVGWAAKLFTKKSDHKSIDTVLDYIKLLDKKETENFIKRGQVEYLIHTIEKRLHAKLTKFESQPELRFCLPHHTLLAKDTDTSHPECRLAYKLACFMATSVTSDVLYHYFSGGEHKELMDLLQLYYRHPVYLLNDPTATNSGDLKRVIDALYGKRWWLYADEKKNRLVNPWNT